MCSKVMIYNEVCSYPDFYTQANSRHTWMHKHYLSLSMRTWIKIANVHVISLPSVAGIIVLEILVFLNIKSPEFSLLAIC